MNKLPYPKTVERGFYRYGEWVIELTATDGNVELYRKTYQPDLAAPQMPAEYAMRDSGGNPHKLTAQQHTALYSAICDDDAAYEAWVDLHDTQDDFLAATRT